MQRLDQLNLAQKHWTRNPKESKKTKEVKFAVEAIEMDDQEQVQGRKNCKAKNKLKDARISKIENESKVKKLQWMHTMD